ncbi:unnamed protein product [Brachionus calyciflorus]|uniref:Uncharacterized protein n=1 Tax=Brachionus calyciflorus TaxID=104777 RepID=A0A814J5X4_9BILA|nr:unnamed protein product [Brachionus calyciflorus]
MGKKKVSEAQRWQIIRLLKEKTKSQQEIADLVGVSKKCVFITKCNYEKTKRSLGPKNYQGLGDPQSLPVEMSLTFLERKSRVFVKRFTYEKYHPKFCLPKLQNGGGSGGIWGCINHQGTGCCTIYSGRINQFVYMENMENHLLPSAEIFFDQSQDWIFQQNGACSNNSHSVRNWFQEKQIPVLPWCSRSPDLNTKENLKSILFDEWLKVPIDVVKNMIESMSKRVADCIKDKGGHFKC